MYYDHNDSGLYYKTTILTNLALDMIVIYDCETFIEQAAGLQMSVNWQMSAEG